eukprot:10403967-Alexandrium_andersonii.AAC.1
MAHGRLHWQECTQVLAIMHMQVWRMHMLRIGGNARGVYMCGAQGAGALQVRGSGDACAR